MFAIQAIDFQNCKDSTKITQRPHLDAQLELEPQAHMFAMQAFDL